MPLLMFTTAAARAGTTLEGAWMIGDNLDADIAGGQGVGARTVGSSASTTG